MDNKELQVKQANDKYLFEQKQTLELLQNRLKEVIEKQQKQTIKLIQHYEDKEKYCRHLFTSIAEVWDDKNSCYALYLYLRLKADTPLYFTFGKYKDRIVQDILIQNRLYCKWFMDNIRGQDLNTLKILDYMNKYIKDKTYFLDSVESILKELFDKCLDQEIYKEIVNSYYFKDYVSKIQWYQFEDKYGYDYTNPTPVYQETYTTHYSTSYPESIDLGCPDDYCNEFCYYGDPILSEGDLC